MAGKTVSFNSNCDLLETKFECLAKWMSCNGEIWGVGPTMVFASAAALFLYHELEATVFMPGDGARVTMLEKTLVSTMVAGMLALMIHMWVCSMRFFQYYLDTLIKDSPNMLLEMTTAGLLGNQAEIVSLGPLTRFLRQQQPQIHITVCWFLSLCYADYVRKHYCQRFNMPYLEQCMFVYAGCARQAELHERASRRVNSTMAKVNSFVGAIHQRLRGYVPTTPQQSESATPRGAISCNPSRISWGCRRGSDVNNKDGREVNVRLVGQSSETAADAIEKLRTFIAATRCSCSGPPVAGVSNAINTTPPETKKLGRRSLEEHCIPTKRMTTQSAIVEHAISSNRMTQLAPNELGPPSKTTPPVAEFGHSSKVMNPPPVDHGQLTTVTLPYDYARSTRATSTPPMVEPSPGTSQESNLKKP